MILSGSSFVNCLNTLQIKNEIKKLNDAYPVYRELKDIYLNRGKQETVIDFIRYITYYSLIFLVLKQVKEHNNNE